MRWATTLVITPSPPNLAPRGVNLACFQRYFLSFSETSCANRICHYLSGIHKHFSYLVYKPFLYKIKLKMNMYIYLNLPSALVNLRYCLKVKLINLNLWFANFFWYLNCWKDVEGSFLSTYASFSVIT